MPFKRWVPGRAKSASSQLITTTVTSGLRVLREHKTDEKTLAHRGARLVELDELKSVPVPIAQGRWFSLSHGTVLERVVESLDEAGFIVRRQQLGLLPGDARLSGVLDLDSALTPGASLSVDVRNSTDKSLPLGFCAGSRVFCCDNLAFYSELLVKRKQTRFGEQRFGQAIADAVTHLNQFRLEGGNRIQRMMQAEIANVVAECLILQAFEKVIVTTPHLPRVIKVWPEPRFEAFQNRRLDSERRSVFFGDVVAMPVASFIA